MMSYPAEPGTDGTPEPVAWHTALSALITAVLATVWGLNPDAVLLNALISLFGGCVAFASMVKTRSEVTPLEHPRDDEGRALVASPTEG